jgi:death-on-curing protein
VIYLNLDELLFIAERTLGSRPLVRDVGLLQAALARPQASAFGADAYPDLMQKASALAHSIARNHGLVDGNKRLALAMIIAYLGVNGYRLTFTNDAAYDFIIGLATGEITDIATIAEILASRCEVR